MPTLKTIEQNIERIEGFKVAFCSKDGSNLRGDIKEVPSYPFERKAPDSWTLSEWKSNRFNSRYFGVDIKVFNKLGLPVTQGNTKLSSIRNI